MLGYQNYKTLVVGCGIKKEEGAWNVDILKESAADEVLDITNGLSYEDNSFDTVIADYVLCQICDRDKFKFVMNELHRVISGGGTLKLKVPNAEFSTSFRDPMDCRYFIPETFDHFNVDHYRYKVFNYGFKPWKIINIEKIGGANLLDHKDRLAVEMSPVKTK